MFIFTPLTDCLSVTLQAPRLSHLSPQCSLSRHLASAEGFLDVVEWLLSHGVDPNPIDRFKRTPLEVRPYAWSRCAWPLCH